MNIALALQGLATLSWAFLIGIIALAIVRGSRGRPLKGAVSIIIATLVFALVLTTVSAGLVFIQPDERGVVISAVQEKGYREVELQPGLRWVIPFVENVRVYKISRQTYTMSIAAAEGDVFGDDSILARTKDGQEVIIDASVIYAVDPTKIVNLHIAWQDRYQNEVVRPLARGIIRDMASQYGVEEIVSSKRLELVAKITQELTTKFAENDLLMVDFVLRNIHFSDEYAAAVEQKQIAEQTALQAEFVVEQRKQEAEQARQVAQGKADSVVIEAKGAAEARLIEAEAESKALEYIAKVIQDNPDMLTYQYISKLSPAIRVMVVPSNSPYLFTLPETDNLTTPQ
ncbi:MAG TPA: prohibitin family protein [Anaerolineales bacterium]|nr:prohibitin family protein [Anaerolineales bacterium]